MTDRAERIERIRELLEDRRHPERRVGIFSATNLTRLVLRFGAMALAAVIVQRILGTGVVAGVVAAIAIGAADQGVARLWKQIGRRVKQTWNTVGLVAALLVLCLMLLMVLRPAVKESAGNWISGWIDRKNAQLDQKARKRRVMVDPAAAADPHWQLQLENGALKQVTFEEAKQWCASLGQGWQLPPGLGGWPKLDRYPNLGSSFYVWTFGRTGIQIGDGQRPSVGVSGAGRPTEVRPVLCLKES